MVEKLRIVCKSHCRPGWGQWEVENTGQKPKDRQTHLDFMLGPMAVKEEFKAGKEMATQGRCFIHVHAGVAGSWLPKDVHVLLPRTCEYVTSYDKRHFVDTIFKGS